MRAGEPVDRSVAGRYADPIVPGKNRITGRRDGPGSCTAVRVVDRDPSTPEEGDIHKSKQQEGRVGR